MPNVLNRNIYYFSEGKFLARVIRGPTAESKASDQSGLEERGMRKAEVFLNRNDRGKGIHCFMRIEFTHLGKMEVEVSLRETLIGIKIHLEDRQKADLVKENLSLLKAKLQEAGLVPGTILCEVKEMGELDLTPFLGDQSQSPPFHLVI